MAQKRLDSLAAATDACRSVFGVYPPSNNLHDSKAPQYGAQCLYYYLKGPAGKGWAPSTSPAVSPEYSWPGAMNVSSDWVTTPVSYGGKAYFNDGLPGTDRAILYYRANWKANNNTGAPLASTTSALGLTNYYTYTDNADKTSANTDSPFWSDRSTGLTSTKQQQWQNEITDWVKTSDGGISTATAVSLRYPANCNSYLLISAGMDREFGLPSEPSRGWASDDVMNFRP